MQGKGRMEGPCGGQGRPYSACHCSSVSCVDGAAPAPVLGPLAGPTCSSTSTRATSPGTPGDSKRVNK